MAPINFEGNYLINLDTWHHTAYEVNYLQFKHAIQHNWIYWKKTDMLPFLQQS